VCNDPVTKHHFKHHRFIDPFLPNINRPPHEQLLNAHRFTRYKFFVISLGVQISFVVTLDAWTTVTKYKEQRLDDVKTRRPRFIVRYLLF
jgi:hypothetical protein